ncbi:MAG: phosphohydrolase [Clostridia bacterium]|nr:phosphohydrolase [Clostridia bacterium]
MTVSEAIAGMLARPETARRDAEHLMKVWAYARLIGELEGLDERTQRTLEYAAVVHDIACPVLRRERGSAPGSLQEEYGPPMARAFYAQGGMDGAMLDRVCLLVGRHHTYTGVDGPDLQILLEADFLVNAGESEKHRKDVNAFRKNVFKTKTGLALLDRLFETGDVPVP